jgi:hypothetical protein
MVMAWLEIHVRAHLCGALAVVVLVLLLGPPEELVEYYRAFHERRLDSSPTPSSYFSWYATIAGIFMVVLLIGFMVGSKRQKKLRVTSRSDAPKWSTVHEVYNYDLTLFMLNLPCWKRTVGDVNNRSRFVPYSWGAEGFHIDDKYTTIELFVADCCTTTLNPKKRPHKHRNRPAAPKKGFFSVSNQFSDPNGDVENRFLHGYGHFNSTYAGAGYQFGSEENDAQIGCLNYNPKTAPQDKLDYLVITAGDMFCEGRTQWMQEVKVHVLLISIPSCCLYSHTHLSPHSLTQAEFVRKGLVKTPTDSRSSRVRRQRAVVGLVPVPYTEVELNAAMTILQMINQRIAAIQQLIAHDPNLRLRFYWGKGLRCYTELLCCIVLLYSVTCNLDQPHI